YAGNKCCSLPSIAPVPDQKIVDLDRSATQGSEIFFDGIFSVQKHLRKSEFRLQVGIGVELRQFCVRQHSSAEAIDSRRRQHQLAQDIFRLEQASVTEPRTDCGVRETLLERLNIDLESLSLRCRIRLRLHT